MRSTTADGIVIEPLYTADVGPPPAQFPTPGTSRRASHTAGLTAGWDIRQAHRLVTTPSDLNDAILTDLARGVTSIELDTSGLDPESLQAALDGVHLDLAPISLRSNDSGVLDAREFLALASSRVSPTALTCDLGCDPIGSLARSGGLTVPIQAALVEVAELAAAVTTTHPMARGLRADSTPFANAGASPATELAALVSAGVAYLRALTDAGISVDTALRHVLLVTTVGTDQFGDIAKLRALRVMWARVAEASGVPDHKATIQGTTSGVAATAFDPWVNMLRTTIGCFAAACGGADAITIAPFDSVLGGADQLGFRVARNTQLVLLEESNVHRVIDPGGGSWYIETLTDQLAAEAWTQFQQLESAGGVVGNLTSGALQARIGEQWDDRASDVATRSRLVVGVTEFPDLNERELERSPLPPRPETSNVVQCEPLPERRLAQDFEALRRAAKTAAATPTVFLANLGDPATHGPRAAWATNFFESGGIAAIHTPGFDDDHAMAEAFGTSGAALAVICSTDDVYRERALDAISSLRSAGADRVFLAGHPGDDRAAYEAAGVDDFIHVGCNSLEVLRRAHECLRLLPGVGQ